MFYGLQKSFLLPQSLGEIVFALMFVTSKQIITVTLLPLNKRSYLNPNFRVSHQTQHLVELWQVTPQYHKAFGKWQMTSDTGKKHTMLGGAH